VFEEAALRLPEMASIRIDTSPSFVSPTVMIPILSEHTP
jgi:hypothetical protein